MKTSLVGRALGRAPANSSPPENLPQLVRYLAPAPFRSLNGYRRTAEEAGGPRCDAVKPALPQPAVGERAALGRTLGARFGPASSRTLPPPKLTLVPSCGERG